MAEYTFNVEMSCSGCSGAVTRALTKLDGVQKVDCDLEQQTVVVQSDLPRDVILATIKKTGKNVRE
ncbi:hypothetical protein BGW37DRAFT_117223 [Umbelopsis sp. PMI_123]|nr:hypothetical protein BGW37DRAFT_117223 [Umbelopsis sp. PMI_123]